MLNLILIAYIRKCILDRWYISFFSQINDGTDENLYTTDVTYCPPFLPHKVLLGKIWISSEKSYRLGFLNVIGGNIIQKVIENISTTDITDGPPISH